ncbi:DNA-binding IclR family transcriptional regulator [Rhizobium petrolearium]|uniref:IclR family transcriptional regulator n=1 Tax=Neorhizobium petrolearium TaxID=515361 RepID=UPI001AE906DC|nr:IclR family transcriptional regulator [Neorhizobium petrolearium]MBP1845715.1 DNA-binding IclR family transcriptional regulator [Neorhizobium petrolearium]
MNVEDSAETDREQGFVQTITVGYRLVQALEQGGRGQTLKAVAAAADMPSWKAYPYLVSLARMGIVVQNPDTLCYGLGPGAAMLGLSAISQADVLSLAPEKMQILQDQVQLPVYLSVLGNLGPTIVRKFDWDSQLLVTMKLGHVLPLMSSGTGAIFLSYLPLHQLTGIIRQETGRDPDLAAIEEIVTRTRRDGVAVSERAFDLAFCSVSAGIFDHEEHLVAAITILGMNGRTDLSLESRAAELVLDTTRDLSRTLGSST